MDDSRTSRPTGVATSVAYLPELESLRGIAMLLVFLFHLDGFVLAPFGALYTSNLPAALAYVRAGRTGVSLFFILSAFLLSLPFLAEAGGGKPVALRTYFARRALRILPLYYAAVVAGTALTAGGLADLPRAIPYFFFLQPLAQQMHPYSNVWWSLFTEVQFYALLPLLPLFLRSRAGRVAGVVALVAYMTAYAAWLRGGFRCPTIAGQLWLGMSLFGRAPLFLFGILAAAVYRSCGDAIRAWFASTPGMTRGLADLVLLALLVVLGRLLAWEAPISNLAKVPPFIAWHIAEGVLWTGALLLLLLAPLRSKRLFANRVFERLGVLSYSIYVLHLPVIVGVMRALRHEIRLGGLHGWNWKTLLASVAISAGCYGLSTLTYRFIERPFLVRKERLRA